MDSAEPNPGRAIRAVLLDVDGTLLDSNDQHAKAWVDALREYGRECRFADVRPLIGMGGDKLIPLLSGLGAESDAGRELSELRTDCFARYLSEVRAFPQARELLQALRAAGYQLCVATSAKQAELEDLLRQGGLLDLLPLRTSSDDAENSKPDPDILAAALRKCECPAAQACMLGDTPYDAEAAERAGVGFVGLSCGGHTAAALRPALAVYRDPSELLERLSSSPLAPMHQR